MMRPRGITQARQHMLHLFKRRLKGSRQKLNRHYNRSRYIVDILWAQFQVGPYQYQVKHLRWYLTDAIEPLLPATRYQHWLTVKILLEALGKEDEWIGHLQGSWTSPSNDET